MQMQIDVCFEYVAWTPKVLNGLDANMIDGIYITTNTIFLIDHSFKP